LRNFKEKVDYKRKLYIACATQNQTQILLYIAISPPFMCICLRRPLLVLKISKIKIIWLNSSRSLKLKY
jgi:hypothetical protein